MEREELIALVSNTLAIVQQHFVTAQQRGDLATAEWDVRLIEICTELGSRLVAEGTEVAPKVMPITGSQAPPPPAECPHCAARRARRNAVQNRHRKKKRAHVSAENIARD